MEVNPKISVVVPLYNKAPYICRTVESVLAQTFQDFEVVVVDDGSDDGSGDVVKQIRDERVRLITQENMGVSAARNRGIKEAKSDLIAFLDADDVYKPCFLETILCLRDKYPHAGAYSTAYEMIKGNGKKIKLKFKGISPAPWEGVIPNYFMSALGVPPVCSSATMVPKYVFNEVGFFPEGETKGEDLDMWLRIALEYPIAFSSCVDSTYFLSTNNSANNSRAGVRENRIIQTANNAISSGKVRDSFLLYVKEYICKKQLCAASDHIKSGQIDLARSNLVNCRTRRFFLRKIYLSFLVKMPVNVRKCVMLIREWMTN